jgi:predicted Zn-dependent peptidase
VLQEIGAVEDTPDDLVYEFLQEAAFADQPLGRTILGTPESVSSLSRDALVDFRGRHYRAQSTVIAAAGAVRHAEIVERASELFAPLESEAAATPGPARWTGGERRLLRDLEQAHVVLAWPGLPMGERDALALGIFASIVGGGMSSRLFQEVREKRGLAYAVHAFHWAFSDTGVFGVYAGTGEADLDELVPVVLGELAGAIETASEREMARAKAQMRMSLEMAREQPGTRAERLARQIFVFGRPLTQAEVLARLDAITLEDVRRTGAAALGAPPAVSAVGPVERMWDRERIERRLGSRDTVAA